LFLNLLVFHDCPNSYAHWQSIGFLFSNPCRHLLSFAVSFHFTCPSLMTWDVEHVFLHLAAWALVWEHPAGFMCYVGGLTLSCDVIFLSHSCPCDCNTIYHLPWGPH
jgi:hypothetical protein